MPVSLAISIRDSGAFAYSLSKMVALKAACFLVNVMDNHSLSNIITKNKHSLKCKR